MKNHSPRTLAALARVRSIGALVLLVGCGSLLVAACGGGAATNTHTGARSTLTTANKGYTVGDLRRFALSASQLPSGYAQTAAKAVSASAIVATATTRQLAEIYRRLVKNGLEGLYATSYHKSSGGNNNNPGSFALAFATSDEADASLPLLKQVIDDSYAPSGGASGARSEISVTGLGDQSLPGVRFDLGDGLGFYAYFWRDRNVDVFIGSADTLGDLSGRSILLIAKEIDYSATR